MKSTCMIALFAASLSFAQAPAPAADAPPDAAKLKDQLDRANRTLQDWANLKRYHDDNAKVAAPTPDEERVVLMGDSITDGWGKRYGKFFPGKPYLNRGIGGQTTPQMLIRFRPDVIALKPKAVVILAGTNDIAGNTGPETLEDIENNLASMAELAEANKIKVVFSSVMPVCDTIRRQTDRRPNSTIIELNKWIKDYAAAHNAGYIDYFNAMLDSKGEFKQELTFDCLHPNSEGYDVMMPLAQEAIDKVVK